MVTHVTTEEHLKQEIEKSKHAVMAEIDAQAASDINLLGPSTGVSGETDIGDF
jgi:hypothetical protein